MSFLVIFLLLCVLIILAFFAYYRIMSILLYILPLFGLWTFMAESKSMKKASYVSTIGSEQGQPQTCKVNTLDTIMLQHNNWQALAQTNVFTALHSSDIVRTHETFSLFSNSLIHKIRLTHEKYQRANKESYAFYISAYPADVQQHTCKSFKTINMDDDTSKLINVSTRKDRTQMSPVEGDVYPIFQQYSIVKDKNPRYFEIRKYQNGVVVCEHTDLSRVERVQAFCGSKALCEKKRERELALLANSNFDDELDDEFNDADTIYSECMNKYNRCQDEMPETCLSLDQKKGVFSPEYCVSAEQSLKIASSFLVWNDSMDILFCPEGCSYYSQIIQRAYKIANRYCTRSYIIAHCGPQLSSSSQYNLNIREITNICRDLL